jgi:hypothetical protein
LEPIAFLVDNDPGLDDILFLSRFSHQR